MYALKVDWKVTYREEGFTKGNPAGKSPPLLPKVWQQIIAQV